VEDVQRKRTAATTATAATKAAAATATPAEVPVHLVVMRSRRYSRTSQRMRWDDYAISAEGNRPRVLASSAMSQRSRGLLSQVNQGVTVAGCLVHAQCAGRNTRIACHSSEGLGQLQGAPSAAAAPAEVAPATEVAAAAAAGHEVAPAAPSASAVPRRPATPPPAVVRHLRLPAHIRGASA